MVYLTFDDGPSPVTEKVLDVLAQYQVPGTFFVIGNETEQGADLYRRILDEGHALGLHTYSHNDYVIYRSIGDYQKDYERIADWVFEQTGESPKISRMVGGSHTVNCPAYLREQILTYLVGAGYACYDWDIDPKDSGAYALPARTLANNVIASARKLPGQDLIVLLHDDPLRTTLPDALVTIIAYFQEQGYAFGVLGEETESAKRIWPKALAGGG